MSPCIHSYTARQVTMIGFSSYIYLHTHYLKMWRSFLVMYLSIYIQVLLITMCFSSYHIASVFMMYPSYPTLESRVLYRPKETNTADYVNNIQENKDKDKQTVWAKSNSAWKQGIIQKTPHSQAKRKTRTRFKKQGYTTRNPQIWDYRKRLCPDTPCS